MFGKSTLTEFPVYQAYITANVAPALEPLQPAQDVAKWDEHVYLLD